MPGEGTRAKAPRKVKAAAGQGTVDLESQVLRLTELVASLQGQIAALAQAPPSAPPSDEAPKAAESTVEEPVELPIAEPVPEPDTVEAAAEPPSEQPEEHPEEQLSEPADEGEFKPYDPSEFALDFEQAISSPDAVDWNLLAHDEEELREAEEGIAVVEAERELYVEMLSKHPDLLPNIKAHNFSNPPDYVVRDLFWEVVAEKEGKDVLAEIVGAVRPEIDTASLPFDQSILDDLLAEAAMAEAAPPSPPDPLLDMDFSNWKDALSSGEEPLPELEESPLPNFLDAPSKDALAAVDPLLAIRALALPYRLEEGRLLCRAARPYDEEAIASLREAATVPVDLEPHPISMVVQGLRRAYSEEFDDSARADMLEGAQPSTDDFLGRVAAFLHLKKAA